MPKKNLSAVKKTEKIQGNNLANGIFFESFKELIPGDILEQSLTKFHEARICYSNASILILQVSRNTLLSSAFLEWVGEFHCNDLILRSAEKLVKNKILKFVDERGNPLSLGDLNETNLHNQIDEIRCQATYSIQEREEFVETVLKFFKWLSLYTNLFIPEIEDPDRQRTKNRLLDHDIFVRLFVLLDERCRMIAKLLYFGGNRTLDEIVKLHIEDIDFEKRQINVQDEVVNYPPHVFTDLKLLIEARSTGAVFLGRNNTSINPSTMFRNFKDIGSILGLPELSPKALVAEK